MFFEKIILGVYTPRVKLRKLRKLRREEMRGLGGPKKFVLCSFCRNLDTLVTLYYELSARFLLSTAYVKLCRNFENANVPTGGFEVAKMGFYV